MNSVTMYSEYKTATSIYEMNELAKQGYMYVATIDVRRFRDQADYTFLMSRSCFTEDDET